MADIDKYVIPEDSYKADMAILDKYITFSSELLRISLLAMGGYGTLITIVLNKPCQLKHFQDATFLFVSMVIFALSAGATLFHRFYASDSMAWQAALLRAYAKNDPEKVTSEYKGWISRLKLAEKWLIASEWIFGAAVLCFIIGLGQFLF